MRGKRDPKSPTGLGTLLGHSLAPRVSSPPRNPVITKRDGETGLPCHSLLPVREQVMAYTQMTMCPWLGASLTKPVQKETQTAVTLSHGNDNLESSLLHYALPLVDAGASHLPASNRLPAAIQ